LAALFEERDLLKLLCIHDASGREGGRRSPHRYAIERLKLVMPLERHKPEVGSSERQLLRLRSKGGAV
jgi:hypothetical protein